MPLQYATIPTLRDRLNNRLAVVGASIPAPTGSFGSTLGAQQIQDTFLIAIGEEIEAAINAKLRLIYVLPIVSIEAIVILRGVSEKLIVSEATKTFFNVTMNPQLGGDANFGGSYQQDAIDDLEVYTAGYGIYYRKGSGFSNRLGNQVQQAVPLPGVVLALPQDTNRSFQPFDAIAVSKSVDRTSPNYIDWGGGRNRDCC